MDRDIMKVKLGDIVQQIRGVSYKKHQIHPNINNQSILLLRANNIQDNSLNLNDIIFIDKRIVKEDQYLQQGDILISSSSGSKELVGKSVYINKNINAVFGAFCKLIRPKETVCSNYIGHFFCSNKYKQEILSLAEGISINNIRNEHIENIEIPLLPIEEQKKIANILDKVTSLISLRKEQLKKLDELIKSRFIEMFGDIDLNYSKENWVIIKDIGHIISGSTPKTNIKEYWNGNYRWLTPAEIQNNTGYIYDSSRKITELGIKSCSLQELPVNTIILSSRAPIGKLAIAGNTFYCNQGFKNIVCNNKIIPYYLYFLLLYNTDFLISLGRGATFKEISKSIIENIAIPLPPLELQNKFASFVEEVEKNKEKVNNSLNKLETLKNALMQKYFG